MQRPDGAEKKFTYGFKISHNLWKDSLERASNSVDPDQRDVFSVRVEVRCADYTRAAGKMPLKCGAESRQKDASHLSKEKCPPNRTKMSYHAVALIRRMTTARLCTQMQNLICMLEKVGKIWKETW